MLVWVTAAVALVAVSAWLKARRLARKLEALTQSYWELRYDFTRLRTQVARVDPETAAAEPSPAPAAAPGAQAVSYISLASMKKKG